MMDWEETFSEEWLHTHFTLIPLDKIWSTPITNDNPNAIPNVKAWIQNHRDYEPVLYVKRMEDGTYFAPEQYILLQSMKEAGRTAVFCEVKK